MPGARRILFLEGNTDGTVGGSYFVLLDLVMNLDRQRYTPIVGFHTDNYLVQTLREAGIETIIFEAPPPFLFTSAWANRWLRPLKRLANLWRRLIAPALHRARYLQAEKIDLLNLNNSITRNHAWMLAAALSRTPCMTHEMGINARYGRLSRLLGRRLRAVVCVSQTIRDHLHSRGIDWPNLHVVLNGIDVSRYRRIDSRETVRARHGIAPDAPVFGVVGNIRRWKGQETAVRATALLRRRHPRVRCLLVGAVSEHDADYEAKLRSICEAEGLGEHVVFAGFQRNAIDYMAAMDVVAHTSVDPEPFGIVTLEAMLLSRPLVSTTIGGPTEVVIDGQTGRLVEPADPQALAAAIDELLSDPKAAQGMGKAGYERLLAEFTMKDCAAKTMHVYAQILDPA